MSQSTIPMFDSRADSSRPAFRPSLTMLGWGLNEEQSVRGYIERAEALLAEHTDDFEVILFDDGSTDRTWEIAEECRKTRPWLRVVRNPGNRGPAYCMRRGFPMVTKQFVFWQTCDWAYDIDFLLSNLHLLQDYDILQGVRIDSLSLKGIAGTRSDSFRKGVISAVNYWLIRCLFRLPLNDYQNVTVYPADWARSLVLQSSSSFANPEMLLKSWWKGASFHEVPVGFIKRTVGVGKGTSFRRIAHSIRNIFGWWFLWNILRRRPDFGRGQVKHWSGSLVVPSGKSRNSARELPPARRAA
jgi:glycosyltransferase involved in cell wall biosynthesis